jgi:Rv2175c C-terminal domain of unknown function
VPDPELESLVDSWFTVDEVAELMGLDARRVRRLFRDRQLVGVRRAPAGGGAEQVHVPTQLLLEGRPMAELPGTVTLLADAGFTDEETLRWLFTPDPTLPGTPIESLRAGRKTEVRRRAQALAF